MIVDAHTHVFSPSVIARRDELLASEPVFAEIYANRTATMATADDVLRSMDEAGVNRSVICNFAWRDEVLVDETNAYIIDAAQRSDGRLIPFVSIAFGEIVNVGVEEPVANERPSGGRDTRRVVRQLAAAGARGIGELRPERSGYDLANSDEADLLAWASAAFDLALLCHVSEPVGHFYPGKQGLSLGALYAFLRNAPGVNVIAAHWGGGLPFFAHMPEVRETLATTYFDTSAEHLLYDATIYRSAIDVIGAGKILFASDFPLAAQAKVLARLRDAGLSDAEYAAIAGGNAARLFGT